jgi:acyl carrier protein
MSQQPDESNVENLSRAEVLQSVCAELAKLGPLAHRQIRPDSDLASELNIDSLDAITVVLALNSRFGVDLPNLSLDAFRTPERITDVIMTLTDANGCLSGYSGI